MWIGAECENRWDELAHSRAFEREFARRRREASRSWRFKVEQKPETDPSLETSGAAREASKYPCRKTPHFLHAINELVCEICSLKVAMGGRYISAPIIRPKRSYRRRVLVDVAAVATARYGVPVSPSMVDRCWKEYRRVLRRTKFAQT